MSNTHLYRILILLTAFLAPVGFAHAEEADDPFAWRDIPPESRLLPETVVQKNAFHLVRQDENGLTLRFENPPLGGEAPDIRDRFQVVVVTPAGGVQDVSFEAVEREFFKGDNPVEPSVPPKDSAPVSRIAKKELGEIRGADL
ncbi:MAG: hypothetical protein KC931_13725, partial [Candidatus Omnitrophica bacterium]|nr:hypothetical protein [Candidatus Omnitrophota bacterium]